MIIYFQFSQWPPMIAPLEFEVEVAAFGHKMTFDVITFGGFAGHVLGLMVWQVS